MKNFYYILLLLIFSPQLFAQEWKDSLREARQSYLDQKYDKSFRQYRSAQKIAPKEIDLSDEMGQSAYKAQKYEEAERIFSQSSSNKGSVSQRAKIQRQIGNSKMHQKKYDEAIESYKTSLRINPNDERSRYNLAEAMRKQKAEEQKQQNKKNNKDNQSKDQKEQDGKKDDQKNQTQPEEGEKKDQQQNADSKGQKGNKQPENQKPQLSDKKTERTLDDLMKKEMETKKKFQGVKSTSGQTKGSGKDW